MLAAIITRPGGPEVLEIQERPTPAPGAGEVLVRVRASALNRADLLQREGRYPAPPGAPPDIPGLEYAGEIAALGAGVSGWQVGARVFGITAGGAHAEFVVVHADTLARVPKSLSWKHAGAVPEVFMTAHDALVTQAGLKAGDVITKVDGKRVQDMSDLRESIRDNAGKSFPVVVVRNKKETTVTVKIDKPEARTVDHV